MSDANFIEWLQLECSYLDTKQIGNGMYATIAPFLYTHDIIVGHMHDRYGYMNRWSFHTYDATKAALDKWDGTDEPQGWHRHPATGRRFDADGNLYIAD